MPSNYLIDVQNPFMEGLKGIQLAQQMRLQSEQLQQAQMARQRQQELQSALTQFASREGKTIDDYRNMMIRFPELSKQIQMNISQLTEEQRQGKINRLLPIYAALKSGNDQVANELIDEEIRTARFSGNDQEVKSLNLVKKNLGIDPKGALTSARLFLYGAMGEDRFADMDKQLIDAELGGGEKSDTLRMSELLPDMTMVGVTDMGNIIVKDVTGKQLYGQDAQQKVEEAQQRGIDLRAEAARAEMEARKSVGEAAEVGQQVFNIMKGQQAIDDAIRITQRAIDKGEWTGTGPLNKFLPKMNRTSQELISVANRMGLAELSQVTMGALSEKELEFIQAASFPQGMAKEDLLVWLKNRKASMNKMAKILTDISVTVGRPDPKTGQTYTMGDWLRDRRGMFNESVIDESITPRPQQQATQPTAEPKQMPVYQTLEEAEAASKTLPKGTRVRVGNDIFEVE